MWQHGMVSAPVRDCVDTVEDFLIDVGAAMAVGKENLVPLCDFYHHTPCVAPSSHFVFLVESVSLLPTCANE
uniref:Uncharacterized protein n=1 Tax=Angiostrongylus cantonensis TaxID=6313 RepID=A0A0K0CXQ0_ANGCA